jgi:hypothetical protein
MAAKGCTSPDQEADNREQRATYGESDSGPPRRKRRERAAATPKSDTPTAKSSSGGRI